MLLWVWLAARAWLGYSVEAGYATCSWYGQECQGRQTANAEIYDYHEMTCAHVSAPFNSLIMVSNRGKYVVVRVNDRIPRAYNREIDLSRSAFALIEDLDIGVIDAHIVMLIPGRFL